MTHAVRLGVALPLVALGGAVGAELRWVAGEVWPDATDGFAWTTFAINVLGCLLLALLPAVASVRGHAWLPPLLGAGLLGGFTTLSTWSEQVRALADAGRSGAAGAYLLGTLAACLAAAWVGRQAAERVAAGGAGEFDEEEGNL